MSAYNNTTEPKPTSQFTCAAYDCKLPGSIKLGGEYACPYHSKAPTPAWPKITQMLKENWRYIELWKAATKLQAHEYDQLQQSESWALDEFIKPQSTENFLQWQHRAKTSAHKVLMGKTNQIADSYSDGYSGYRSNAVAKLISGELLKRGNHENK